MRDLAHPGQPEAHPSEASRGAAAVNTSSFALIRTGQPYHLLARNSAHRWWRPVVALAVFLVITVIAVVCGTVALLAMMLFPPGALFERIATHIARPESFDAAGQDPMSMLFVGFATLVLLFPAVVLTVRWTQKRPFGSVGGVTGGLRWRWLGRCLPVAAGVLGAALLAQVAYQTWAGQPAQPGAFPGWGVYSRVLLIAVMLVPLQSAAEEYVFRGLLLQTLTAWFRTPWVGMSVSSVLFLLGHGYTDPLAWCELLLMAMTGCWLTIRTGGLEATIAMHAVNNALSLALAGLAGVPNLEQSGDFAFSDIVPYLVAMPLYAWLTDRRAARRQLSTVVGGRARIAPWSLRPRQEVLFPRDDLARGAEG